MNKPNRRRFAALLATSLVLSSGGLLAGCGSGHGSSNPSPTVTAPLDTAGALRDVQTGQAALNALLMQSQTPSAADLQTVSNAFASAHAKDPNNAEASTLLGLLQISAAAENVANVLSPSVNGKAAPLPASGNVENWRLRNLPALKSGLLSPRFVLRSVLVAPLSASGKAEGSGRAAVDGAKLRTALQNLQTTITNALPLIQQGANKADFSFSFADFDGTGGGVRVMDQADVTAILADLYDTRAALNVSLAYNTDTNGFDWAQTLGQRFAAKNVGDTVSPDEYLPAPPFGTLLSGAGSQFAQAKGDLVSGADTTQLALSRLQNRSSSTLHLIDSGDITAAQYAEAGLAIVAIKASLGGPVTVPLNGSGASITLNLKAWFDNPPQNLRALLPTYTVALDGSGAKTLRADAASYPDKTFGGLIPRTTGLDSLFDNTVQGDQSVGDLLTGFLSSLGALGSGL